MVSAVGAGASAKPSGMSPPGARNGGGADVIRILIGLIVPFVAVDLLIPLINAVDVTVFDIPFVFLWLFCWFVLTSLCLAICWYGFDRTQPDSDPGG